MKRKAFTLLEILLTMGILAVLGVVTLPSLLGGSRQTDLNGVATQIEAIARQAENRSATQTNGAQWGIHIENATASAPFYALFSGSSYASGVVQSRYQLPSTVGFASSTIPVGSSVDITFAPVSSVPSASTTIQLYSIAQPSIMMTLTISSGGQIGMASGASQIAPASSVRVWVVDLSRSIVEKFKADGTYLSKFGSPGSGDGQMNGPGGIGIDAIGNIYVADYGRMEKFDADGHYLSQFGSFGTGDGQMRYPSGIAFDSNGNSYVADTSNHRVEKFDADGHYVSQFVSAESDGGYFGIPQGIALDSGGNIYVVYSSNRVEKFDANTTYISQFGSFGSGDGQFNNPRGIAFDSGGNIYVADFANRRIEKFDASGHYLSQFGSYGTGDGQFQAPIGVAIDSDGNIYVVDVSGHRVQKFDASGHYLSQFGSGGSGDGQFQFPYGLVVR